MKKLLLLLTISATTHIVYSSSNSISSSMPTRPASSENNQTDLSLALNDDLEPARLAHAWMLNEEQSNPILKTFQQNIFALRRREFACQVARLRIEEIAKKNDFFADAYKSLCNVEKNLNNYIESIPKMLIKDSYQDVLPIAESINENARKILDRTQLVNAIMSKSDKESILLDEKDSIGLRQIAESLTEIRALTERAGKANYEQNTLDSQQQVSSSSTLVTNNSPVVSRDQNSDSTLQKGMQLVGYSISKAWNYFAGAPISKEFMNIEEDPLVELRMSLYTDKKHGKYLNIFLPLDKVWVEANTTLKNEKEAIEKKLQSVKHGQEMQAGIIQLNRVDNELTAGEIAQTQKEIADTKKKKAALEAERQYLLEEQKKEEDRKALELQESQKKLADKRKDLAETRKKLEALK